MKVKIATAPSARQGLGHDDPPIYAKRAASIYPGRVVIVLRDRHEELTQQEDEERAAAEQVRDVQGMERVQQSQVSEDKELWDQRHVVGDHQGAQHQDE